MVHTKILDYNSVVKFIGHRRQRQGLYADALMGGGTLGWLLCT